MRAKDLIRPGIMGTEAHTELTTVDEVVRTVLQPYEDGASRERIVVSGPDVPVGGGRNKPCSCAPRDCDERRKIRSAVGAERLDPHQMGGPWWRLTV
jgi:hypothetical protein